MIAIFIAAIFWLTALRNGVSKLSPSALFLALLFPALSHVALDLCQSEGLQLLWPFSSRRFFADLLANLDIWLLAVLLAGVLLPWLAALVSDEIGAKSTSPRGRIGAALTLILVIAYIATRGVLHSNAVAIINTRTYHGEIPRRVAALPQSQSPLRWTGIIETQTALHQVDCDLASRRSFDPESAFTSYKPEPSPSLQAAQNTVTARQFLAVARFPKATVERTVAGYHVQLRDFVYIRNPISGWHVKALIDADLSGQVLHEQLAWDANSPQSPTLS
jgi:hypothetical protein